jgi:excisionase family DNA binding protein
MSVGRADDAPDRGLKYRGGYQRGGVSDASAGEALSDGGSTVPPPSDSAPVTVPPAYVRQLRDLLAAHVVRAARRDGVTVPALLLAFLSDLSAAVDAAAGQPVPHAEPLPLPPVTVDMTVVDAARVMGASPEYVRRLCRKGRLRARRPGRDWQIEGDADGRPVRADRDAGA